MTMQTARGLFTMQNWKESPDVNNDNADSSRLFTMPKQNWKESDVNNDKAYLQCQNWKESGVNNDNADSSRLFTMQNWKEWCKQ